MFLKWTVAVGVALALAGASVATDALAQGGKAKKTAVAKPGKKVTTGKAPTGGTGSTGYQPSSVNQGNSFGLGGPYMGIKYRGNVP